MVYYREDRKNWKSSITINGKRYTKSGFSSKRAAELWEAQIRIKAERNELGLRSSDTMLLENLTKKFVKSSYEYKKHKAAKRDESAINVFLLYCDENNILSYEDVKKNTWVDFVNRRVFDGRSKRTINIDLQTINRMFIFGVERDLITNNPFNNAKLFKLNKPDPPVFFTPDLLVAIETLIKSHNRYKTFYPIFYVLARTGLRSGELCTLKKQDINFHKQQINVRPENTKARENRNVPINSKIVDVLKLSIANSTDKKSDLVFTTSKGKPYDTSQLSRRFQRIMSYAKQKGIIENPNKYNVHSLRKSYISNMVMAGVDPQKIMRVVGHKEWATMKRYLHLLPNYGNDIIDKINY